MAIQALSRHGNPAQPEVGTISVDVGDVFQDSRTGALHTVVAVSPAATPNQTDTVDFGSGPFDSFVLSSMFRTSYHGTQASDPQWPAQP